MRAILAQIVVSYVYCSTTITFDGGIGMIFGISESIVPVAIFFLFIQTSHRIV